MDLEAGDNIILIFGCGAKSEIPVVQFIADSFFEKLEEITGSDG